MSGDGQGTELRELPRYWPGIPLPEQAYLPGQVPPQERPSQDVGLPAWDCQESSLRAAAAFRWGSDLYNHGFYWEAHEEWEGLWKQAAPGSTPRFFLQGLIQCAAACLKGSCEQWTACQTLCDKGMSKLAKVLEVHHTHYQGIHLHAWTLGFRAYCEKRSATLTPPRLLLDD